MAATVPPGQWLPDRQPAYVASWIYVFGVLTLAALLVVIASGVILTLGGLTWWHVSSLGHFVNSLHLWSVELFFGFMVGAISFTQAKRRHLDPGLMAGRPVRIMDDVVERPGLEPDGEPAGEAETSLAQPVCIDGCATGISPRTFKAESPGLRRGGVQAGLVTTAALETTEASIGAVSAWWRAARRAPDEVRVVTSVVELRSAVAAGVFAAILHFQGTVPLGTDVELVDAFHRLGVRVMQPTYNYACPVGDGCLEERDAGLSTFGRKVVERMQQVGIAVDVSHAGRRVCLQAVELARVPVIASHANARMVWDSPRNLDDEVIDKIAATGGVIGLCAFPGFVSADPGPTLDQLLDHAVYIADRVGPEHLSLGTDFIDENEDDYEYYGYDPRFYPRPPWNWPSGLSWWPDVANLGPALQGRGFSEAEAAGVLGENLLRALDAAWSVVMPR
jgi:membrane dipeptidase